MISTGKPIDDSVKLKQWKAEYFNGTNVLERGVGYVLSDEATGKYFTVTKDGNFIPLQLTGKEKVLLDSQVMVRESLTSVQVVLKLNLPL